ncbi:MAG: hypothetical protein HY290_06620 [Planctomycetia bacterium]|nr:hypothetical protein [Planctomycetia bacterium]
MKIAQTCLPLLLLATFSGCISTKDCIDRCLVDCRNRCYAEMAWLSCKSNYCDVDYKCDFGKGFKDGYVAVASGGGLCQPALPPREYWGYEYQNPDGQERQLAWFNGYSYGALYAEQEGISDWSRVVTSPTLPPYRKKRQTRRAAGVGADAAVEDVQPYGDDGIAPPVEPMPTNETGLPPSASADIDNLEEAQADASYGDDTAVRWTDAADGY